jgi:hypothetical protein
MGRAKRQPKVRQINPTFYVFCEGETEKEYINYLRSRYRIPIEIKSKISGSKISQRFVSGYLSDKIFTKNDKVFLFYDEDVSEIIDKLKSIKDSNLLLTNPCIELWFILHKQDLRKRVSSEDCVRLLKTHWKDYKKSLLTDKQKNEIDNGRNIAIDRAKELKQNTNPSTNVYEFIEELEEIVKQKSTKT